MDTTAKAVRVLMKEASRDSNDVCLVMTDDKRNCEIYTDDLYIIRFIEESMHIILSDYAGKDLSPLGIEVGFEGISFRGGNFIHGVEKLTVNDRSFPYKSLNPGIPGEDFHHRYIDVPVDYSDPNSGKFKLYFEINSGFDPSRETIMIPTDPQRYVSQVGWADRYKQIFDLDLNVVTYEYRGMPCSRINELSSPSIDWKRAYEILNTDNASEDIERIRKDLLGERKINILGGSGIAMMSLKYMSRYPDNVNRAFLLSFFLDAEGSSRSGIRYFETFLRENSLEGLYFDAVRNTEIKQFLFIIQRLLYYDENEAMELIRESASNDLTSYERYCRQFGTLDYFVRFHQKYYPWCVVFMYETNIPGTRPDINYPFEKIAEPLRILERKDEIKHRPFHIQDIENINTEILLAGGTRDQVAPLCEMEKIYSRLPNARLAVFDAYHCLQVIPEARESRNELANIFFRHGLYDGQIDNYLMGRRKAGAFLCFHGRDGQTDINMSCTMNNKHT